MSTPARSHRVVDALVEEGLLPREDAALRVRAAAVVDRALAEKDPASGLGDTLRSRFAEIAGYVGAAFVAAAAVIFLADQWSRLSTAELVAVLAGVAVVLAAGALGVTRLPHGVLQGGAVRRLASTLFVAASVAASAAVGVAVDGSDATGSHWTALLAFTVSTAGIAASLRLAPTLLGQTALAVSLALLVGAVVDRFANGSVDLWTSIALVALAVAWVAAAERGWHVELTTARATGCLMGLVAAQAASFDWQTPAVGYALTLGVAVAAMALYTTERAWPYLATGVAGLTLVVPEALMDWTDGALGVAGGLLAAGVALLVASLLALRLRRAVSV